MPITHTVTEEMAAIVAADVKANGALPMADLPSLDKFGKAVEADTYTDHRDHRVQDLMFVLRTSGSGRPPSYWSIAMALGCRHSADTEAGTHAAAKRAKADESWKLDVAARATMLRKQGLPVRSVVKAEPVAEVVAPVKAKATVKGKATPVKATA